MIPFIVVHSLLIPTPPKKYSNENRRKKNPSIFLWKFNWMIVASLPPKKCPIFDLLCKTDPFQCSSLSAEQRRSTILCTGSWRVFWFYRSFYSMIFGQAIGKIRHGGRDHMLPFLEVVWHGWFFGRPCEAHFLLFSFFVAGSTIWRYPPEDTVWRYVSDNTVWSRQRFVASEDVVDEITVVF
jgi:hypothetical protein